MAGNARTRSTPDDRGDSSLSSSRRVRATMTDERWFDIDPEKLAAYYGDDVPEDLGAVIDQWLCEGEGFPEWCAERHDERYFSSKVEAYEMCEKHDRVKDTKDYHDRHKAACGSCWCEAYDAAKAANV